MEVTSIFSRNNVLDAWNCTLRLGSSQGPPDATFDSCLGKMAAWVRAAKGVLDAEFPEFQIWNAMEIFALGGDGSDVGSQELQMPAERHFHRLAQFFNVGATQLRDQWMDLAGYAKALKCKGMSEHAAWKIAIQHQRGDARLSH